MEILAELTEFAPKLSEFSSPKQYSARFLTNVLQKMLRNFPELLGPFFKNPKVPAKFPPNFPPWIACKRTERERDFINELLQGGQGQLFVPVGCTGQIREHSPFPKQKSDYPFKSSREEGSCWYRLERARADGSILPWGPKLLSSTPRCGSGPKYHWTQEGPSSPPPPHPRTPFPPHQTGPPRPGALQKEPRGVGRRGRERAGREGLWLEGRALQLQWGIGGGTLQTPVGARPTSGGSQHYII